MAETRTVKSKLNVFISYSRQDTEFVDRLQTALRSRGIEAFVDRQDVEKAEEWWARIKQLITEADTIVFTLSPGSVDSKVCKDEVEFAEKLNKRFVPIVARDLEGRTVPGALARLNYIFFIPNSTTGSSGEFEEAVSDLVHALETDIPWIREHTRLGALAERWETRMRPSELLLRGAELSAAETWLTTRPEKAPIPTDAHRALITLSRRAATRRQTLTVAGSLVAAAVGLGLAGLAYWQRGVAVEQRNIAEARRVEAVHQQANVLAQLASAELRGNNVDAALRASVQGVRVDFTLPVGTITASPAAAQLAAAVSGADWHLVLSAHDEAVNGAAFSPDGARIVTASWDQTARIWNAATGKEIAVLRGHESDVYSAAFSPDGMRIVTASEDKTARIWDAATGKEVAVLRGHEDAVNSAAFSPDGTRIVTASHDKTARIWDATTGKEIAVLRGHRYFIYSAAFSPDGTRVITASGDRTARVWDAATANEIIVLHAQESFFHSAGFSPDGTRIVTASWDKTARIWETATGTQVAALRGHENAVQSAAFSPDGMRVVTSSFDKTARVWDAVTGEHMALPDPSGIFEVLDAAFSPDGKLIVTATQGMKARIWDVATSKQILALGGDDFKLDPMTSAAFSPDGSRIVTASDDKARIWDTTTGKEIAILRGHEGSVISAAFSPDGMRIVTASRDKTVRIWDATTGKEIAILGGREAVSDAALSPEGSRVVAALGDNTARIWDVHFATMSTKGLLVETCSHRLNRISKLSRDDMRLLGYADDQPEIDGCEGVQ
jgi:WD40 repeat protein